MGYQQISFSQAGTSVQNLEVAAAQVVLLPGNKAKDLCSRWKDQVIISHYDRHDGSAAQLCNGISPGPDFVSVKAGLYCDNCAKKAWPLCTKEQPTGCFDMNTEGFVAPASQSKRIAARNVVHSKSYNTVTHWKH